MEEVTYSYFSIALQVVLEVFYLKPQMKKEKCMKNQKVSWLVRTAIMTAISVILYNFVKFPIPFIFPGFLDVQISNLPAIISGFMMGPLSGCLVVIARCIIKLPLTSTAFVGELADLIIGLSVVLVSSLIYKKNHSKKGAIIALVAGSVAWVIVAVVLNWLILAPFYIEFFFQGNVQGLIAACSMIPGINESNYMILYLFAAILPFNLLLASLNGLITFVIYKRIHFLFSSYKENTVLDRSNEKYYFLRKFLNRCLTIGLVSIVVLFLLINYDQLVDVLKSFIKYGSNYYFDFDSVWTTSRVIIVILSYVLVIFCIAATAVLLKKKKTIVMPLHVLVLFFLTLILIYSVPSIKDIIESQFKGTMIFKQICMFLSFAVIICYYLGAFIVIVLESISYLPNKTELK